MISVYWVSFFLLADFYLMEIFPVLCGSGVLRCHVVFFVFLRFLFIFNQKKIQIFFLAFLFPSVRVHGGGKYFFKIFSFFLTAVAGAPFLLIFASSFVSSSFPRSCSFFFSFVYDFRTAGDWRGGGGRG